MASRFGFMLHCDLKFCNQRLKVFRQCVHRPSSHKPLANNLHVLKQKKTFFWGFSAKWNYFLPFHNKQKRRQSFLKNIRHVNSSCSISAFYLFRREFLKRWCISWASKGQVLLAQVIKLYILCQSEPKMIFFSAEKPPRLMKRPWQHFLVDASHIKISFYEYRS